MCRPPSLRLVISRQSRSQVRTERPVRARRAPHIQAVVGGHKSSTSGNDDDEVTWEGDASLRAAGNVGVAAREKPETIDPKGGSIRGEPSL